MSSSSTIEDQLEQILSGCEFGDEGLEAAMRNQLRERLRSASDEGRQLRVYVGYDPTAPDLHLGHSIPMRKLRKFQELGHDVIVVVGTMTALIGDTSDKMSGCPRRSPEEVRVAARTYAEQVFLVLDRDETTIAFNADWLSALSLGDVIEMASSFTVQQFLARETYRERISRGNAVGLHEFLYALLQSYDAVHLRCDVQIGGTDQLFNIRAGGKLQEAFGQLACVALTYPLLVGTDGVEKMSKSLGNYIGIAEAPEVQFGKVMHISDQTMLEWVPLVTGWDRKVIEEFSAGIRSGALHPMEAKKRLALEVVSMYHGKQAAEFAKSEFERVHQRNLEPSAIPEITVDIGTRLIDVLLDGGLAKSRSEVRRLIVGSGITVGGKRVADVDLLIEHNALVRIGKRRFLRVRVSNSKLPDSQ